MAAGGLGLLIGDGALNYREEKFWKPITRFGLAKWATLSFDYQFISNPAYNADRGPVHLIAGRLHAEFGTFRIWLIHQLSGPPVITVPTQ